MKNLRKGIMVVVALICAVLVGCAAAKKAPEKVVEKAAEVVKTPTEAKVRCVAIINEADVWSDSSVSVVPYGEMPNVAVSYGINRVLIFGEFRKGEHRHYESVGIYVEDLQKLGVIQDFPEGVENDSDGIIWFRNSEATPY